MIAGAVSGAVARLVTAPLDVIKIRFQLQISEHIVYTSSYHALRTIIAEEGIRSLWKGNLSATYLWASYGMVQFGTYTNIKAAFTYAGNSLSTRHSLTSTQHSALTSCLQFLSGATAGGVSTALTYPFDLMRTQFVIQGRLIVYPTFRSFIEYTHTRHGLRGFYTGLAPSLMSIVPNMGLNFMIFEYCKKQLCYLSHNGMAPDIINSTCGAISGGVSKFLTYPFDTIKKRIQQQVLYNTSTLHDDCPSRYRGVADCAAKIWKHEGIRGFYKGTVPTVLKSTLSTAITFAVYEHTLRLVTSM